jgi:transglutaminase-like putative cysteine protease
VKALLLMLLFWMPLRQESNLEVLVACRTPEIFNNYRNYNFKQEIRSERNGLNVRIKSHTLDFRNLNHVLANDGPYVAGQDPVIIMIFNQLRQNAMSVGDYLRNLSGFLRDAITYSEADLPQDTKAVLLNRKAHCIGYANVAQTLLACAGIVCRPVNGFYLRENNTIIEPVPHRWLEIDLPGARRVFYDPQYQDFSARYLVTDQSVAFNRIERFLGIIVKKNKKIMDE